MYPHKVMISKQLIVRLQGLGDEDLIHALNMKYGVVPISFTPDNLADLNYSNSIERMERYAFRELIGVVDGFFEQVNTFGRGTQHLSLIHI